MATPERYRIAGRRRRGPSGGTTSWPAVIAGVPVAGGVIEAPAAVYPIAQTWQPRSSTRLFGVGSESSVSGVYTNGTVLKWTGAIGGTVVSFFDRSMVLLDGLVINGNGIASIVGLLIDSDNAPAGKANALRNFGIFNCGQDLVNGYGVRIGTSAVGATTQNDTWELSHGDIRHCDIGVSIYSANAGYQGKIEHVNITAGRIGVEVVRSGNFAIRDCAFGGHSASTIGDIVFRTDGAGNGGTAGFVIIESCQTEKDFGGGPFVLVDPSCTSDGTYPVLMISNRIGNVGIDVYQTKLFILVGNVFTDCNFRLLAGNPAITDIGTRFNGTGIREVTDAATTNASPTLTSATAAFVAGDVGKRVCASGSGPVGLPAPNIPDGTEILAVVNGTTVTLSQNATATASGQTVRFDYGFVRLVGTIASLSPVIGMTHPVYTVTNHTDDRALNETGDTLVQGLNVLGTLIADLRKIGLIH